MPVFPQISKDNFKYLILLIWPFGAFLFSLTDITSKSSRVIFFIFCLLFGLSFIPKNQTADSYSYYLEFIQNGNLTLNNLKNIYLDYFSFDGSQRDLYSITMVFIVTRFSDNYHLLFFAYSLIFTYFYISAFGFMLKDNYFRQTIVCLLLAFLFTFSNPVFNINGVRFWTAAWIAVYGIFKIVVDKNYKYYLLFAIIPLIHISFFSLVFVLVAVLLLIRYEKMWIIIFFISFFSGMFVQELLINYLDVFPKMFQYTINEYASNIALMEKTKISEKLPLYAIILNRLPFYYLNLLVGILIIYRKKLDLSDSGKNVFIMTLILFSFVNFIYYIPSLGDRYLALTIPFLTILWLRICNDKKIKWLVYAIPLVYSYSLLHWLRNMISVSEPYLYLASLPHIIIKYLTESTL